MFHFYVCLQTHGTFSMEKGLAMSLCDNLFPAIIQLVNPIATTNSSKVAITTKKQPGNERGGKASLESFPV